MCLAPAVVAGISLAMTAVGTYTAVQGNISQGKQASAAAAYNKQLAENDAIRAEQQATDAIKRGATEEDRFRDQSSLLQGEQVSALASSGFTLDSGSPLQIMADTAEAIELDAQTIRYNAQMEAMGYENNAQASLSSAEMFRVQGNNASTNSYISAGTSLLSGLGQAGMQYGQMKQYGLNSKKTK